MPRIRKHFFILFFFINQFLFAQTDSIVMLKDKKDLLLVGKKVFFLEDERGNMQIEDILRIENQKKFQKHDKDVFARPANRSVFWFKINIQNQTNEDAWLEIGSPFAWYIDFYSPDSLKRYTEPHETGIFRPCKNRFYEITHAFWLPVNPANDSRTQTYYLRISSEFPFEVPLQVGTLRSLNQNKDKNDFMSAGFIGLVLVMVLYNLFLYISTKDQIYVYYLFYLFFTLIHTPFIGGYSFFENSTAYEYYLVWGNMSNIFGIMFCIKYLELRKNAPFFRKILLLFGGILCLIVLAFLLGIKMVDLITIYQIILGFSALTSLLVGYYLAFKRQKNAIFYILGWTFALLSILAFIAVINGFLPFNPFTRNILYFGIGLEICMFSLALGNRMNTLKAENLRLIKDQNAILEQKVQKRTNDLKSTLDVLSKQRDGIVLSINYALRIQNAIIPAENELQKELDCFVLFRPKDIVSGDFYWFAKKQPIHNPLPSDQGIYIISIVDCTGHGVSGAFMTIIGNNILNQIIHDYEIHEPDRILNLMTPLLEKILSHSEKKLRDGMDIGIVTIQKLANLGKSKGLKVEYAGAKIPLYYIQNQELRELKADRVAIGGLQRENFAYQKQTLIFDENNPTSHIQNSTFYLCSDGFQDQFGGEKRQKFLSTNFKKRLLEISEKPMLEQKQILEQTFDSWKGKHNQTDDMTVIGIKI